MRSPTSWAVLAAAPALGARADSSPASPLSGAPTLAEEAAGASQSPVDLRSNRVTFVNPNQIPALIFRYGRDAALDVVNIGSPDETATVRADVTKGGGVLRVGGRPYELLQFHWHTPSEHRINGEEFPLEMHLVHRNTTGALLVVGGLIRASGSNQHPLQRIFRDLPEEPGDRVELTDFPLPGLLPERLASIRYSGSLTTPPFAEPVAWIVLRQPLEMSADQIEAFRELFEEGNAREPQPLNGRRVVSDANRL